MNKQWTGRQASRFIFSVRNQRQVVYHILLLLVLTIGMTVSVASRASAAPTAPTFTVNTTSDGTAPGACNGGLAGCSLREAIIEANHFPGAGVTINIPAGTYGLSILPIDTDDETTGNLNITANMTIVGAGAATTIIDANQIDNVFFVPGVSLIVNISNVTIRNGKTTSQGGGINSYADMTLNNSIVTNNSTTYIGGGIFVGNTLTLNNSTVSNNSATYGGGIENEGTLSVNNTTINGNIATTVSGGGIHNYFIVTLTNSTVSNNSAAQKGGGIYNDDQVNLYFSTIAGNLADNNATGIDSGGGIYNNISATVYLLKGDLLAENYAGATASDCAGSSLDEYDYDYIQTLSGCSVFILGTNYDGGDPMIDSLRDHGGSTQTRALFVGSPAIGKIPAAQCTDQFGAPLTVDQRGFPRPSGSTCDIGAYEGSLPNNLFGVNLIRNGDAEGAAGSPTGASVGFPYWNGVAGIVPYGASGGFPTAANLVPPTDAGYNFFSGAYFWPTTFIQQTSNVQGISAAIDTGQVKYNMAGYFGGYANQDDHADLVATFLDTNNSQISISPFIGDVTAADRGNVTELLFRTASGVIPKGTRSIVFRLTMVNAGSNGTYTDGYADNLSLVLSPPPLYLPLIRR